MKNIILFLIVLFLSISYSLAYSKSELPKLEEKLKKDANAIVVLDSTRIIVKDESFVEKRFYAITILNKDGLEFSRIAEHYNSFSKIVNIKGKILDSLGKERISFTTRDIIDLPIFGNEYIAYRDDRFKVQQFKLDSFPFTLQYEVEKKYNSLFFLPNWSPQNNNLTAINKAVFELEFPEDLKINMLFKNFDNNFYKKTIKEKGNLIYNWTFKDISAFKYQPFSRTVLRTIPKIELVAEKIKLNEFVGVTNDWNSFGKFFYEVNKDKDILTQENTLKIQELVKSISNDREKIAILYKYLQKNTRYMLTSKGILGWQSISAEEVKKSGYGDCKGLSNYMRAMLKAVNIPSYLTLAYAGDINGELMDAKFPNNNFNHMILCVPLAKDTIWLECTSSDYPLGFLGTSTHGRDVLLLTQEGGKIARTPYYGEEENKIFRNISVDLDFEKAAQKIIWNSEYIGDIREELLPYCNGASGFNKQEYVNDLMPYKNCKFESLELKLLSIKNSVPKIDESILVEVSNIVSSTASRKIVNLNLMNLNVPNLKSKEERTEPFIFEEDFGAHYVYSINFPKEYELENLPKTTQLKYDFGNYSLSTVLKGNQLQIDIDFALKRGNYPVSKYNDYLTFQNVIEQYNKIISLSFLKK